MIWTRVFLSSFCKRLLNFNFSHSVNHVLFTVINNSSSCWAHYREHSSGIPSYSVFTSAGARVKEVSLHVSHSAVAKVINELDDLRSNHSDVMEAEAEAKSALDSAIKNHDQLKAQITEKEATNENYQKQLEVLLKEKSTLQANLSALGELHSTRS